MNEVSSILPLCLQKRQDSSILQISIHLLCNECRYFKESLFISCVASCHLSILRKNSILFVQFIVTYTTYDILISGALWDAVRFSCIFHDLLIQILFLQFSNALPYKWYLVIVNNSSSFGLRRELKVSQCPSVRSPQVCLRAVNLHLFGQSNQRALDQSESTKKVHIMSQTWGWRQWNFVLFTLCRTRLRLGYFKTHILLIFAHNVTSLKGKSCQINGVKIF